MNRSRQYPRRIPLSHHPSAACNLGLSQASVDVKSSRKIFINNLLSLTTGMEQPLHISFIVLYLPAI